MAVFDSQYNGYCKKELSCGRVLSAVVDLLPVGQPPGVSLVSSDVGCALQVVEHDVHELRREHYVIMMSLSFYKAPNSLYVRNEKSLESERYLKECRWIS